MAQRTDIVSINFQANARGANAAIESLRVECERCNDKVKQLKDQLKAAASANMPADQIDALRKQLNGATKEAKQFDTAYKELVKGMRTLDQGIKAFNDGSLSQMNQAFQKALYNAAKLTRTKLNPLSETYKRDKQELTALMDASQQYYARQQADSAMVIKTIKEGGKVSRQAINDELTAHRELLQVLAEDDAGYQRTVKNIAVLEQYLRAMGGDYDFVRQNIRDTQKVSDEMLRNMYNELQKTNQEGKVTKDIMRENAKAMKEIRAEQARRVESTLGGDLTKQNEGAIRAAIASARELLSTYQLGSKQTQTLSAQIVNAEEHLKLYGVEAERTARREAAAVEEAAKKREESHQAMEEQLRRGTGLTQSALRAQEQYWQRMADDPKAASNEIARYFKNLNKVRALQKEQEADLVKGQGVSALQFFRGDTSNASADQIKEQADALKKYRNSLPRKDNADLLIEIDSYLAKSGQVAKEATGELMNLGEALEMAGKAGKDGFSATEDEIKKAIASIEKAIEIDRELAKQHRRAGNTQMAEYNEEEIKEYEKALKGLNLELKNVGISHERMQKILENPINADNLDELRAAIKRAKAELNSMDGALGENREQYDAMAKSVKQAEQQLKTMEGQAKGTASAFEKAWSRLKTYVGLYVGASVAMNKLMGTMGDLMDLSDKMGEVRKTTGFTADEVGRLSGELKKFDTRTTLNGLLDLSVAAGQLGLKTEEDVLGFTEAANKLMVALPEMGKEGATEMLKVALATGEIDKIRKQMEQGLIDGSSATAVAMEKVGSTIDRLRATSAATAPAITDFVKRVGAVGAQSGITIDQVAALGSTVDALGMRVEMSATALSRMIPAIKNNAFALAQAIGVTPETIRNLFDTGRGMEVILMVLQRIKDSGMDADSIENMLGMAGMKDIMKDLNQQGARAGIVFAGLSQNVDELRRQLGIAKTAYEENIAIQQEYDKMNSTTAAKWERLKNQLEETFVGDGAQRFLGGIIDGLRWIVDLLTGNNGVSVALRSVLLYLGLVKLQLVSIAAGALKSLWAGLKNIAVMLGIVKGEMTKLQWGNIFTAAAAAVLYLVTAMKDAAEAASAVSKAMGEIEKEMQKEMATANMLFQSLARTREQERLAAISAKEQAEATKKDTEAQGKLSDASKKLAEQTGKVEEGMKRVNIEGSKSSSIIREINSKYSTYLGYMLSETSSAEQLARARELINSKLRETITLKQQEAAMGNVEQEYGGNVNKKASAMDKRIQTLFGNNYDAAARVSVAISEAAQKYAKDSKEFEKAVKKIMSDNFKYVNNKQITKQFSKDVVQDRLTDSVLGLADDYREAVQKYQNETEVINRRFEATNNVNRKNSQRATVKDLNAILADWKDLVSQYKKAEGEEKEKLAVEVYKQQRSYANAFANNADYFKENDKRRDVFEKNIENMKTYEKGLREVAGEAIRTVDAMERADTIISGNDFTNGGDSANNPWGKALGAESTDWKNMTAEQLVNRRKQMNQFVNAIQTDTDVQSVLKEDAALKKAIEKGMSSDMRTVIEWYNTERLKIQDELHARHLTNTGDWMDPKKERGARKQFRDEMDAYLHELDAYYTERKTRIEEAGTDEGLTEAEIRNRTLNNEMEWQQRRAELQKLYSRKQKEVTQEELNTIYHIIAERTGDSESFVKAQIAKTNQFVDSIEKSGEKGAAIVHRWMSQVELDTERSYLKGQQALTKQMRAIEAIIDKERPFNGITKSLQESLSTMDILTGEMRKEYNELMKQGKNMTDFNNRQAQEEMKRTAFLLGEAENAYSTTIDRVMDDMRQKGMTAWADWLSADPKLQEALMAQLRSTYDAIQDAIKKEASQLKKQAEIMWNNILMPDGKTTLKQTTDRVIAQLGLDEGRVKRANSLIGAGQASERVADKLAIQQMKVQLAMQTHYYNLMKKQGQAHVDMLEAQAKAAKDRGDVEEAIRKTLDAQHAQMSLNLATSKEETELAKQREDIIARTEESQNRLYTELKSWADLLASSLQSVFEASHAGDAEYYNERAKLNLTGKGGPGAGTYVIIDNAGTEDATAHYEYLDERSALERQREIENDNAVAEAWEKMWNDINQKINDTITDQLNAMLQNQSIDANTQAVIANTEALWASIGGKDGAKIDTSLTSSIGAEAGTTPPGIERIGYETEQQVTTTTTGEGAPSIFLDPNNAGLIWEQQAVAAEESAERQIAAVDRVNAALDSQFHKQAQDSKDANKTMTTSTQSSFAKMTAAMNMYGIAYQAMSNDNLDATQKFQMFALQAAGQTAIGMLTTNMLQTDAQSKVELPGILGKAASQLGPIAGPIAFAAMSALLGGLMGIAMSKVGKAKSQIASVTGASIGAGRLATGMMTYAEGNVNEFTDPASLTPGRSYNVDAADGKTYRARYMGSDPKTHLTNGPEFHLVGEAGREAIIDAHTTRLMQMDDTGVWNAIQTLYNGGSLSAMRRMGSRRGVRAFAEGNVNEFDEMADGGGLMADSGMSMEQMTAFQQSLDRNNELLERALTEGIHARFDVYGKGGLIDSYDKGKKTVTSHGERY